MTMKNLLGILFSLLISPAFAVDNTVVVTPGTGVTMRSKDVGAGVESMVQILGDTSGNPIYGTAGTANANILTVQGIASMTPLLMNPGTAANWGVVTQGSTTSGQSGNLVQCAVTTAAPTYTTAQTDPLSCDTAGNVRVNVTNANANGRATAANSSPVVQPSAPSTWHLIAAASTNATSVKASAAVVFSCQLGGVGSTPAFLKIYNKASAPTVGTDTPVKTLIIPAAATAANGAGSNISFGPGGLALGTGFAAAVTGVITDADTTAVAASTFAINCDYE